MAIKAVTFDLWLTLIWDSKELEEYRKLRRLLNFHNFVKRVGTKGKKSEHISFNAVRLAMEQLSLNVKKVYEKGRDVSPEDRGRMLFELLGIKFSRAEAAQVDAQAGRILSDSGYHAKYPNLNPEAKPVLKELKESGLAIGLVSNAARTAKTYGRMLRAFGIADYFDSLTISCEIGYLKPRKEIFSAALKSLSVKPLEALHIGDLFKADVVGATSYGMNAALYTGMWHKYAQYMNPGEHIPPDFKTSKPLVAKEISSLRQVPNVVEDCNKMQQESTKL
ncbi:MAG: HAD family hydrolase [Thaumarchaeota archaeon]|nr:HAD family hydrolase [Nitrososphaerota archaeon]